jgi:hypothetical protein
LLTLTQSFDDEGKQDEAGEQDIQLSGLWFSASDEIACRSF